MLYIICINVYVCACVTSWRTYGSSSFMDSHDVTKVQYSDNPSLEYKNITHKK